jgi:hypothetical protein
VDGGWGLKIALGAMAKLDKDRYNHENKEWKANMLNTTIIHQNQLETNLLAAMRPKNILCVDPKKDMVECQQLSTAYMSHIKPVFGDEWKENCHLSTRTEPKTNLFAAMRLK